MIYHHVRGKRHSYAFSIDDDAPLRRMYKSELARMYFPRAASDSSARMSLLYLTSHARQPMGRLCGDDDGPCRSDGCVYLSDVLADLNCFDTTKCLEPDHVAAILHFLGPLPDEEDFENDDDNDNDNDNDELGRAKRRAVTEPKVGGPKGKANVTAAE